MKLIHLSFQQYQFLTSLFSKHLVIKLDFKLLLEEHLNNIFKKINVTIDFLCKLQNLLIRTMLTTIYKAFVKGHY